MWLSAPGEGDKRRKVSRRVGKLAYCSVTKKNSLYSYSLIGLMASGVCDAMKIQTWILPGKRCRPGCLGNVLLPKAWADMGIAFLVDFGRNSEWLYKVSRRNTHRPAFFSPLSVPLCFFFFFSSLSLFCFWYDAVYTIS